MKEKALLCKWRLQGRKRGEFISEEKIRSGGGVSNSISKTKRVGAGTTDGGKEVTLLEVEKNVEMVTFSQLNFQITKQTLLMTGQSEWV